MNESFKRSLTEGNRLDAKNLAELLMSISKVSRDFALQLMPYGQGGGESSSEAFFERREMRRRGER